MNINTNLTPLQWAVTGATLCVAVGMGVANAAGWIMTTGEPWGYALALLAIGCEVIAVLVLSAGTDKAKFPARAAVVFLCGVLNVYGGHQFLDLRERGAREQRAALAEKRATLSRDVQRAIECVEKNAVASRSLTMNAARERLVAQCQNAQREAQSRLDALPVPLSEPAKEPWILWALMVAAEVIKVLAIYSVASPASPVSNAGAVVDLKHAARALAKRRHGMPV